MTGRGILGRGLTLVAMAVTLVTATASPALAHGLGGRADLPVPVSYFAAGAGVALIISFLALAVAWREPRLQDPRPARTIASGPVVGGAVTTMRLLGIVGLITVIAAGLLDTNEGFQNIGPVLVWIVFWLVLPFLAVLFGNLWRWMNPYRAVLALLPRPVEQPNRLERWGVWPATVAFVAFTWLELVYRDPSSPPVLAAAAIIFGIYLVAITRAAGVETGLLIGDPFEMYHGVIGAIAPIAIVAGEGPGTVSTVTRPRLVWRGWLRALPQLPTWRGFTWFIIAMIGTVTYDGMSGTEWFGNTFGRTRFETWFGTLGLVTTVAVIGAGYYAASAAAARLGESEHTPREIARSFAHTLVPIAFAYAFAHYFTLVLFEGQLFIHALSDPFGRGWDLFGTATWDIVFFMSPEAIWYIQVIAIVAGHIAGVALAHDRALAEFTAEHAVRTQYAMLVLMVALTSLGLFILAG